MSHDILLEAGTNEMELLTFKLGEVQFGVNVAKIREVITNAKIIEIPNSHYDVNGCIKVRDEIITLVNLATHFGMGEQLYHENGQTIIMEFNATTCGICVDEVCRIYRIKWSDIDPPSPYLVNIDAPITGTVLLENQPILIVDFEATLGEILNVDSVQSIPEEIHCQDHYRDAKILLVDDSSIVRKTFSRQLNSAGFSNVSVFENGQEAHDALFSTKDDPDSHFHMVLSDIEMPLMDGLHLTKCIKEDNTLNKIPVILISSLIIKENLNKGKSVGADAQIKKSDATALIDTMEKLLKDSFKPNSSEMV